jgi:antitoxin VapB
MSIATTARHVRLFKNGRSQAVRIPREFELPGREAIMRKEPNGRLILEPVQTSKLSSLLESWEPLSEADALPGIDDPAAGAVSL